MADEEEATPNDVLAKLPLFPPINLDSNAMPWARRIQKELLDIIRSTRRQINFLTNANRRISATQNRQAASIRELTDTTQKTNSAVQVLNAIAASVFASSNDSISGFTNWYNGAKPTVRLTSPTGKIQVQYGGSLNGGSGYIVFQVTRQDNAGATIIVVNRATIQVDFSRRVALSGGASFAPSGFTSVVIDVPANTELTVTCEVYATDEFVAFLGRSIYAQVAP